MEHFSTLLRGRRFYAYCDHRPIVTLSATHQKTLTRLLEQREQFDFDLRYTPGGYLNPADFLSRRYATSTERVCAISKQATEQKVWNWHDLQEQDAEIRSVRAAVEGNGKCPPSPKHGHSRWPRRFHAQNAPGLRSGQTLSVAAAGTHVQAAGGGRARLSYIWPLC